jgi:transcriptional regulator with XRE-family HTH domain
MVTHRDGGRLLAELRQQAGLTQTELAERAGISRSMVAQIESGERRPSRKMLRALGQAVDASPELEDRLFATYDFIPSGQTPEQIAALLRADKQLTAEQAERIAALVREAYEREMNS